MKVYYPKYYKDFQCIAGACPDSCCKEWAVDVDPAAAAAYRKLAGALGDRLRAVLKDTEDGILMEIENGRCPMWRQDGLCRIHAELGHDALCKTCRDFPRLRHDYGDFAELGLELSCPEAARLIFEGSTDLEVQEVPGGEAPEYDSEIMAILKASRQEAHALLECSYSLPQKLAILLLRTYEVQERIDGGALADFDPDALLAEAQSYVEGGDLSNIFAFFQELEILTERWATRLQQGAQTTNWNADLVAFVRYLIDRYWLQAIADWDLICRVKLIIGACILVNALGGNPAETAQLFSKEIENSIDNVEALLDAAYSHPAFTDDKLLGMLLNQK